MDTYLISNQGGVEGRSSYAQQDFTHNINIKTHYPHARVVRHVVHTVQIDHAVNKSYCGKRKPTHRAKETIATRKMGALTRLRRRISQR